MPSPGEEQAQPRPRVPGAPRWGQGSDKSVPTTHTRSVSLRLLLYSGPKSDDMESEGPSSVRPADAGVLSKGATIHDVCVVRSPLHYRG